MTLAQEQILDNIHGTEIKTSPVHGRGLFATRDLHAGEVLGVLDGDRISADEMAKREKNINANTPNKNAMIVLEWNALPDGEFLIRRKRTKYGFINHSRAPNLELRGFPIEVVVIEEIAAGRELLLDYRKEPLPEDYLNGHGSTYL